MKCERRHTQSLALTGTHAGAHATSHARATQQAQQGSRSPANLADSRAHTKRRAAVRLSCQGALDRPSQELIAVEPRAGAAPPGGRVLRVLRGTSEQRFKAEAYKTH